MSVIKRISLRAMALGIALLWGGSAAATTITFGPSDWEDQDGQSVGTDWNTAISTISGGVRVTINLAPGSVDTGDVLLVGLEGPDLFSLGLPDSNFTNVTTNTGDGITDICYNNNTCGGGGGFNGGIFNGQGGFVFDTVVRIGNEGTTQGQLNTQISFDILGAGFSANQFTHFGLRIQSVGTAPSGGDGSLQIINDSPTSGPPGPPNGPPNTVPLPAAAWMLLAGLCGLGATRLRRQKA